MRTGVVGTASALLAAGALGAPAQNGILQQTERADA
jgi:hypothetical protein